MLSRKDARDPGHSSQMLEQVKEGLRPSCNNYTEAKRCFATHDEDIDYFTMRIYIILIACVYIQQFNFV